MRMNNYKKIYKLDIYEVFLKHSLDMYNYIIINKESVRYFFFNSDRSVNKRRIEKVIEKLIDVAIDKKYNVERIGTYKYRVRKGDNHE